MKTTHRIRIDMLRKGVPPVVDAMQFDAFARVVEIELYSNGVAWNPPDGVAFALSYGKPDGKRGFYETLPDGTSAISVAGNVVSATIAPQALTVAGTVFAALVMRIPDMERLSAFPFEIHVTADPSAGSTDSEDYFDPSYGAANAVLYVPQELTEDQKAQARANIGVGDSSIGVPSNLKTWEITESETSVTLNYTLEGGETHKDVITFNADGYPVSLVHDGFEATGTWEVANG